MGVLCKKEMHVASDNNSQIISLPNASSSPAMCSKLWPHPRSSNWGLFMKWSTPTRPIHTERRKQANHCRPHLIHANRTLSNPPCTMYTVHRQTSIRFHDLDPWSLILQWWRHLKSIYLIKFFKIFFLR